MTLAARSTRGRLARAAALVLGAGAVLLALTAKIVPCIFASVFGIPCPGCGSTRSVMALLHGDVHGVLRYNPLGPVVAVLLALALVRAGASFVTRAEWGRFDEGRAGWLLARALVVVGVLEVALWAARFFGAFGGPVPV